MSDMHRRLSRAARQFADQTSNRLADLPSARQILATIATVTAGAASDGNALVTVTWRGEPQTAAGYFASYTPVVGHRVVCLVIDNQLIIAGRVVGQP